MIIFANAKINLGLHVLSKREDGYHEIESLKFPIPLYDVIEILPSASFQLDILGMEIEGNLEDNLIWKAFEIIRENHAVDPVRIILQKNIPMGAGLGGGSSDATAVLRGLNDFFSLDISDENLRKYAAQLGSDCPFFVANTPQLAKGKGEALEPFHLDLKGKYLYLIHPNIHVSTAQAYSKIEPKDRSFDWHELSNTEVSNWKSSIKNDFENSVFRVHPEIGSLKEAFYEHGAEYAAMSGSGSAVFGIFKAMPQKMDVNYPSQFILEL